MEQVIPDDVIEFSRRILEKEYEQISKQSAAIIILTALDVIDEYRRKGMTFDQIAEAYTKNGVPIKGAALRLAFWRAKKSRESVQAPSARREEQKEVSAARPTVARLEAAPAHETVAAAPVQAFSYEIARPEDGAQASDQELTEEKKIDLIIKTIPPADQEWPELVDFRLVDDGTGKKRDVLELYEEKPDDLIINRRHQLYLNRRRYLMQEYGLGIILESGGFKNRHTLAEKPPITVDLDDLLRRIGIDGG